MHLGYSMLLSTLTEDERYLLEERAAIHEFDGKASREDAERMALEEWRKEHGKVRK